MNLEDRQLFEVLTRRQSQLELSVSMLKSDLDEFRSRLASPEMPPPIPVLPPLPRRAVPQAIALPAASTTTEPPPLPANELEPARKSPLALEFQFGRWLARIGVVFALITLVSFSVLVHHTLYRYLGPWSKLGVLATVSLGLITGGFGLERKSPRMTVYARTLAGGGLACLYYTLYGATYVDQLHVISNRFFGAMLLLIWSGGVLWLAEKRKSELLSVFAIALAYFSSAVTPVGGFTMAADLLLAATAVVFLVRNAWTGLSYLCLIGTYAGFVRQVIINRSADPLAYEFRHDLSFAPQGVYLAGAWIIYTAAIFFARAPGFAHSKRMAFLCLNNGAFAGLLLVAAQLTRFGHVGGLLGATGAAFLASYGLARFFLPEENDVAGAYLMQGLALATGGVAIAFSGVTRGLIITIESVFLAAAGAYSRNIILRIAAGLTGALGCCFLAGEIDHGATFPWILIFGGTLAMLANACLARREFWNEPRETSRFVWPAAYYVLWGLGLLAFGICRQSSDEWVPVDLAAFALVLTFAVYALPLLELAPLSQLLLVLAQGLAFLPPNNPYLLFSTSDWTRDGVAMATMMLATWWPRQKRIPTGDWLQPFLAIYALAMVAFTYDAIQPQVSPQTWMMASALLSLVFLAYGLWLRVWSFALVGQLLLGLSVWTFLDFDVTGAGHFPWTWWAAAVPPLVVFFTGWVVRAWLPPRLTAGASTVNVVRSCGRIYQSIATGLLIRWIFGTMPDADQALAFFAVGTALLLVNTRWPSRYGARTALVFDVFGIFSYLNTGSAGLALPFTWPDGIGFALFLTQPAILKRWGATLLSGAEAWLFVLVSAAAAWLFVSRCVTTIDTKDLTVTWALFAVGLTGIGFLAGERRQRWCGLAILAAAMMRVVTYDFWQFSGLDKVLTFFALTVICLGLSFLYYKFAYKVKEWL